MQDYETEIQSGPRGLMGIADPTDAIVRSFHFISSLSPCITLSVFEAKLIYFFY